MRPIGARPRGMRAEAGAVYAIQHGLAIGGYLPTNGIDGRFGPATRAALESYQRANGLAETGVADEQTVQTMMPVIARVIGDDVGGNDADCATTRLVGFRAPAPTCAPDERWTGRNCVPICRDDQRWNGERCLPRCDSNERSTGRSCAPICRDGESWNGRQCVSECAPGQRCNGKQCVSLCKRDQFFDPRTGRCAAISKIPDRIIPDRVIPQRSRPEIQPQTQPQIQRQQIPQIRLQQLQPQLPLQEFK